MPSSPEPGSTRSTGRRKASGTERSRLAGAASSTPCERRGPPPRKTWSVPPPNDSDRCSPSGRRRSRGRADTDSAPRTSSRSCAPRRRPAGSPASMSSGPSSGPMQFPRNSRVAATLSSTSWAVKWSMRSRRLGSLRIAMCSLTRDISRRTRGRESSAVRSPQASRRRSMRTNSRTPEVPRSPRTSGRHPPTICSIHPRWESTHSLGPRSSGSCCPRHRWSPVSRSQAPSIAGDAFFRPTPMPHGRAGMIARTWHGVTPSSKADAYFDVLKESGLKEYRETPGNQGVIVLRRTEGDRTHFLLITFWESFDAIRRFAGPNPERAVYYPEDKEFLLEFEPTVTHYDVLMSPDVAGTTDRDPFVDPRGRIEDHGSLALHAGAAERLSLPPDDLHAGFPEVVWTPDVHPHAIDPGSVQRQAFGEELREQVLREVELLVHRDELKDLRLEDVDARVREVREGLLLPRLLLELLDAALRVETDDPELGRVLDVGQGDRHDAAFPLVEIVQRLEVDVAQDVAHRDEERVVDEHADPAHGARGARRVLLEAVDDRRVVVEAVADRFDQGVRQVRGRHDDLMEPGRREGAQHVVDARPPRDRDERLRSLVRQRFQAGPFAAREDDRLHRPISTFPFSSRAFRAASADASSFFSSRSASRTARFCWRNRVRASRASDRFAPLIDRTFSRISTAFAWTSSALSRATRNASCFSFPSWTSAAIWWTIPIVSSCTARAFTKRRSGSSCSFSAASKNSVMPESMSLISFAILS